MNYYQFHIGDWSLHTSHLGVDEEGIYRRLLDFYYDTEKPIPEETKPVIRRLRLVNYYKMVDDILEEFFILEDDGWHNLRADSEIKTYHEKVKTAQANGKKGGRPRKKTTSVILANPEETGLKANHKPITINHKPLSSSKMLDDDLSIKLLEAMGLKSSYKNLKRKDSWDITLAGMAKQPDILNRLKSIKSIATKRIYSINYFETALCNAEPMKTITPAFNPVNASYDEWLRKLGINQSDNKFQFKCSREWAANEYYALHKRQLNHNGKALPADVQTTLLQALEQGLSLRIVS